MKKFGNILLNSPLTFYALLIFIFILYCFNVPVYSTEDVNFWIRWIRQINDHGIASVLDVEASYPPVYFYILKFFTFFYSSSDDIVQNIVQLKKIILLFDFISIAVLATLFKKNIHKIYFLIIISFNLAFFYNSILWFQIDGIPSLFIFLSIYFLYRKQVWLSPLFLLLAINTKLLFIIFAPLVLILLILKIWVDKKLLIKSIIACVITQIVLLIPFILNGSIQNYIDLFLKATLGRGTSISVNAFNIWHLISTKNAMTTPDSITWHSISYKNIGSGMFLLGIVLLLIPLIYIVFKQIKAKNYLNLILEGQAYLAGGIVCLSFFYFNTNMHERYNHTAMILFFGYSILNKNWIISILLSIGIFLNLDYLMMHFFKYESTPWINPVSIAFILLLSLTLAYVYYFIELKKTFKKIKIYSE